MEVQITNEQQKEVFFQKETETLGQETEDKGWLWFLLAFWFP